MIQVSRSLQLRTLIGLAAVSVSVYTGSLGAGEAPGKSTSRQARVGVVPFHNIKQDKDLKWMETSLSTAAHKSLQKVFSYEALPQEELEDIYSDYKGEMDRAEAQREVCLEAELDYLVHGSFQRLNSRTVAVDAWITGCGKKLQSLGRVKRNFRTDATMFASAKKTARSIVYKIFIFQKKQQKLAGKARERNRRSRAASKDTEDLRSMDRAERSALGSRLGIWQRLFPGRLAAFSMAGLQLPVGNARTVSHIAPSLSLGILQPVLLRRLVGGIRLNMTPNLASSEQNVDFHLPVGVMAQIGYYAFRYEKVRFTFFAGAGWSGGYLAGRSNLVYGSPGFETGLRLRYRLSLNYSLVASGRVHFHYDSAFPMLTDHWQAGLLWYWKN
jgi:TolB-like protein